MTRHNAGTPKVAGELQGSSGVPDTGAVGHQRWAPWDVLALMLAVYFATRCVVLVAVLSPDLLPDERAHMGICKAFSATAHLPTNTPESLELGQITRIPSMYYYLMGRVLAANVFHVPELVLLRSVSVVLALVTTLAGYVLLLRCRAAPVVRFLFVAVVTNIPMFSMMACAVSYDSLANALAAWSFLFLWRYFERPTSEHVSLAMAFALAGSLTKISMVPFATIVAGMALYRTVRTRGRPAFAWRWRTRVTLAVTAALALTLMNVVLYGGNMLRYGHLYPRPDQILAFDDAMKHRIFAQETILADFLDGRRSYEECLESAKYIPHAQDRAMTELFLRILKDRTDNARPLLNPAQYAMRWLGHMGRGLSAVQGHMVLYKPGRWSDVYVFLFLVGLALAVYQGVRSGLTCGTGVAWTLAVLYGGVVLFVAHYPMYCRLPIAANAVDFRYLLPVVVPACAAWAVSLTASLGATARGVVVAVISVLFVAGDFPWLVANAGPGFFVR